MGLNSNDSELTTLKVVYNGLARRVKVTYDMEWQDFEYKVCRLFNVPPPLVTSYKDNLGVSVIVDNGDDFFFFLDEEYTGRLDIVTSVEPSEASEWTVVRTEAKKVIKEEYCSSELSNGDDSSEKSKPGDSLPRSLTSTRSPSIRGAPSPMAKEAHNIPLELPNEAETLAEKAVEVFEQAAENSQGPKALETDSYLPNALSDIPATASTVSEQSVDISREGQVSQALELDSSRSEVGDEAAKSIHLSPEVQPDEGAEFPQERPPSPPLENVFSFTEVVCEVDEISSSVADENAAEMPEVELPRMEVTHEEESLESSSSNSSPLPKEEEQASRSLRTVCDTLPLSIVELDPYAGTNQASALYSPVAPASEGLPLLDKDFEAEIQQDGEPSSVTSDGAPKESDHAAEELDRLRKGQELRTLCYKFSDVFRHHSALLPTIELLADQISHGVPIDFEVLESGLRRLAPSSGETPRLIEEVTSNLVDSVGSVINQIGSSLGSFIEHDVSKFLATLSSRESQTSADSVEVEKPEVNETPRETVVEPNETRRHHRRCSRKRKSHVCSTHRSESIIPSESPTPKTESPAPKCELPIPNSEAPSTRLPFNPYSTSSFPVFNPRTYFENPLNLDASVERSRRPYSFNALFPAPDVSPYRPMSFAEAIKPISEPSCMHSSSVAEVDPADAALISGLVTLRDMGFHDDSANLEALQANSNNVVKAIDALISKLH